MEKFRYHNGKLQKLVFCKSVRRNGRVITPKKANVLAFWVNAEE